MTITPTTLFDGFPHCIDAHQYALDVVSGKIPNCVDVVLSCQRQIDDLFNDNFAYEFDPMAADRVVNFIETLPHTKGKKFAGKNLKLEPWQKFILCTLFGWVEKATGFRRFREAYIAVPRKNGKSIIAAGIGLYMFCADNEPGAEVYCGATNQKQSLEVFKPARLMCNKRPKLVSRFGIEVNAANLAIVEDGSKFEPVIGDPGDGANPHCWIVDEYHEHSDNNQVDTAISGMGSRDQPLLLMITTAGTDTSSPCFDKHRECQRILQRKELDESTEQIFTIAYGIDKDDDWQDPAVLSKANPNFGVSVGDKYLQTRQLSAIRKPSNQNTYLIKHLNKWVNAKESWLTARMWADCAKDIYEGDYQHLPMVIALDLASKRDICSFMRIYYEDIDKDRHYYVFGHHFLPSDRIEGDDNHSYQGWAYDGYLTTAGEAETDLDEVEDTVKAFLDVGNVREVTFDPWKATQMSQRLEKHGGVTTVEFRQNAQMLSPAMDEVEAAIAAGRLHHDGCPVLEWMAGNVVVKTYKTDFKLPSKEKDHNKIDGMVALIMGIGRAMYDADNTSAYDDRGVREL